MKNKSTMGGYQVTIHDPDQPHPERPTHPPDGHGQQSRGPGVQAQGQVEFAEVEVPGHGGEGQAGAAVVFLELRRQLLQLLPPERRVRQLLASQLPGRAVVLGGEVLHLAAEERVAVAQQRLAAQLHVHVVQAKGGVLADETE